jgi:hypothetical protein
MTKICDACTPDRQWAAVTTQSLLIRVPPQNGMLVQLKQDLIPTFQGHSPGWANIPPTIREPIVCE